jgi:5'(3')-deoxyribonucleotidase
MTIMVDIDDTICNMQQTAINIFNSRHNTSYTLDDFHDYDVMSCMPIEHATKMLSIYSEPRFYNTVKPFKGAKEGIQKLINDGHQVYLVTSAIPSTYGEKVEFINRHFPCIDESHIVAMKHKHLFRCDIMIEDCLQNLLAKPYYHRVCMDQPWNQCNKDYVYDIHRCYNWNDIVSAVNKISELE